MKIKTQNEFSSFFDKADPAEIRSFLLKYRNRIRSIDEKLIRKTIKPRTSFAHKGTFGHCLIIAGNKGTEGASILSAMSALRTGCGLLTAMIPSTASAAMLARIPEAMQIIRDHLANPAQSITDKYNSIGIGPGVGTGDESAALLYYLLYYYKGPLVIDADAITVLSKNKEWFSYLNQNVILTPHPAEFDRLAGEHESVIDRLSRQAWFSDEYNVTIILKGHHTSVISGREIFINTTGNDGMATAGSGDVLTGILTSLCAQGYSVKDAAVLGTYLHGFAGDNAATKNSKQAMIASDIISEMGSFFKKFSNGNDADQT